MFVLQVNIRIKPENVEAFMKKALENAARRARSPAAGSSTCWSTRRTAPG
jgi:hypothetical protein